MKSSVVLIVLSALLLGSGAGFLISESLRTPADILERKNRSDDERRVRLSSLLEEAEDLISSADSMDPAVQDLVSERAMTLAVSLREELKATSAKQEFAARALKTLRALEFLDNVEKQR